MSWLQSLYWMFPHWSILPWETLHYLIFLTSLTLSSVLLSLFLSVYTAASQIFFLFFPQTFSFSLCLSSSHTHSFHICSFLIFLLAPTPSISFKKQNVTSLKMPFLTPYKFRSTIVMSYNTFSFVSEQIICNFVTMHLLKIICLFPH